jgi:hypothetical protein
MDWGKVVVKQLVILVLNSAAISMLQEVVLLKPDRIVGIEIMFLAERSRVVPPGSLYSEAMVKRSSAQEHPTSVLLSIPTRLLLLLDLDGKHQFLERVD